MWVEYHKNLAALEKRADSGVLADLVSNWDAQVQRTHEDLRTLYIEEVQDNWGGLLGKDVAQQVGISQSTFSQFKNGKTSNPELRRAFHLCFARPVFVAEPTIDDAVAGVEQSLMLRLESMICWKMDYVLDREVYEWCRHLLSNDAWMSTWATADRNGGVDRMKLVYEKVRVGVAKQAGKTDYPLDDVDLILEQWGPTYILASGSSASSHGVSGEQR